MLIYLLYSFYYRYYWFSNRGYLFIIYMRILLTVLLLSLWSLPAMSQETAIDEACTAGEANRIRTVGGPETSGQYRLLRCNGSQWKGIIKSNLNGAISLFTNNHESLIMGRSGVGNHTLNLDLISTSGISPNNFRIRQGGTILSEFGYDGITYVSSPKFAGAISFRPGGPETMRILSNGHVGIGTTSPAAMLDVRGDIEYTGTLRDVSDRDQKRDIRKLVNSLDKLSRIEGVSFIMKDDKNKQREIGLIAQDVKSVYPELVHKREDGLLTLNYIGMIGPLVEAVKELDTQNTDLRRAVNALGARMDVLEGKRRPPLAPYNP